MGGFCSFCVLFTNACCPQKQQAHYDWELVWTQRPVLSYRYSNLTADFRRQMGVQLVTEEEAIEHVRFLVTLPLEVWQEDYSRLSNFLYSPYL